MSRRDMQEALNIQTTAFRVSQARILVIDDNAEDRQRVVRLLAPLGHEVLAAASGEQGIDCCRRERPDLVVLDVNLPGEDSASIVQQLREVVDDRWLPVIFVTGDLDPTAIARCFDVGGNDYVRKDVDDVELNVRIGAALRLGSKHEQQRQQLRELTYRRDLAEREEEIAQKIFQTIMAHDRLDMPNLRFRLSSMSVFNGDLLLAARTPDGGLHLLIGDFTGHGLSASIGTLPASEIFYAMSAKGFGIVDVLREINKRLYKLLPVGMFMMGAGVQIDKSASTARIWSGGIPDLLLRRAADGRVERIAASHLPLGVLDGGGFEPDAEIISLTEGDRLLLFTDGVTETERRDGGMFGIERVVEVVGNAAPEAAFEALNAALERFRDGCAQNDDVTLLEYTCPPARSFASALPASSDARYDNEFNTEWQFRLHLDAAALRTFDPRPLVTQILMDIQSLYEDRQQLYTIISELFRICLEQGVLAVDRPATSDASAELEYQRQVAEQLARLEHGSIHIDIDHAAAHAGGNLILQFSQNGRPLTNAGCPTLTALGGLCRSVEISGGGQQVVAIFVWRSA